MLSDICLNRYKFNTFYTPRLTERLFSVGWSLFSTNLLCSVFQTLECFYCFGNTCFQYLVLRESDNSSWVHIHISKCSPFYFLKCFHFVSQFSPEKPPFPYKEVIFPTFSCVNAFSFFISNMGGAHLSDGTLDCLIRIVMLIIFTLPPSLSPSNTCTTLMELCKIYACSTCVWSS